MKRSTFTIYEEFRLIDKEVVDSVIRPFSYIRQTPYLKIPEYAEMGDEPKEVFISSAYHKGLWWYDETKKNIRDMLNGGNSGFIALDFRVAVLHHIKTIRQIKNEISKMDEITALEEYYNIPWGENSASYFKLKQFIKSRNIVQAWYPQRNETYNAKKNPYNIERVSGELRILSCDTAQRGGRNNDLSVTTCFRCIPTHKGYFREVVYMESFSGVDSITQSLRLKRIFRDFDADVIVLDVAAGGGGLQIYDQLGQVTKDSERGIEYGALTVMQHESTEDSYEELSKRTLGINAKPVIYCVSASAKLNSLMAVDMMDKLRKKLFGFLVDETKAEDYLIKHRSSEYMSNDDIGAKAFFNLPFVQTSLAINECINLSMQLSAGYIKLIEPSGARKDRYVSLTMGSYYISFLDQDLLRENDTGNDWDTIMGITMVF